MNNGIIALKSGCKWPSNMTIKGSHCSGNGKTSSSSEQSEQPTSEEDLKILLGFYDTYIYYYYYQLLLALQQQPRTSGEYYLWQWSRYYIVDFSQVISYLWATPIPICGTVDLVDSHHSSTRSCVAILPASSWISIRNEEEYRGMRIKPSAIWKGNLGHFLRYSTTNNIRRILCTFAKSVSGWSSMTYLEKKD